jgi:hypothetical protein
MSDSRLGERSYMLVPLLPLLAFEASLMRRLISLISRIHMWRSSCSISRISSMPQ